MWAVVMQNPCAVLEPGSWLWYLSGCSFQQAAALVPPFIVAGLVARCLRLRK